MPHAFDGLRGQLWRAYPDLGSAMGSSFLPPVRVESRRQQALQALRSAITGGTLQPGDRLIETDIAAQLGVSRGSVREAIRHLEQEGLVISYPYRATEVLGISQQEIEEVLVPIRLTIERFAFREALPRLGEEDLTALEYLVAEMEIAATRNDWDQLVEADVRFHTLVIERSAQVHSLQIWQAIEPRVRAHFRRDAPAHPSPHAVAAQHVHLLAALALRDEGKVLAALDKHIRTYITVA